MTTSSKIALITGAGSGIGQVSAVALAERGWSVVLGGRRKEALDETAAMLPAGTQSLTMSTDFTDIDQVRALFSD